MALDCGRFLEAKRLDVVLDAWTEIERRSRVRLALLGTGPDESRLRAHPYAGRVFWLQKSDSRSGLADLLAAVDFVVAPGPFEASSSAALESLASGTPVLAAHESGVAELVAGSGAGERYHGDEPEHCAEMAVWLSKRSRADVAVRARQYVEERHRWEPALDRRFQVYADLVSGRSRRAG